MCTVFVGTLSLSAPKGRIGPSNCLDISVVNHFLRFSMIFFRFLSFSFQHILRRIDEVGRNFRLRVLLVLVDDEDNQAALTELNKIAFATNFTMIQAWSNQECARYLETFKAYENKSSSSIQAREETEFMPRLQKVMTTVRSVNKTDVTTLMDVFGSFSGICAADEAQLMLCPGIGGKKLKRLLQVLHEPFEGQKKSRSDITSDKAHQGIGSSSSHEKPLDPAKKYEVEGWTNSRTDIVNALREGDSERDTRDDAAASNPVKPPVELAEEDEEAVDPEELNDTIVFGYE